MANIGKLAVQITAETGGLTSGLNDANRSISDFDKNASALAGKLKSLVAPAAIAAGAAFAVNLVRNVANAADELAKLSARTGVSVEDLSRLRHAANLSGVSNEQLTQGITRLSRSMVEASQGTGQASEAFAAMGVSVQNADGTLRNQREVLEDIATRFQGYQDGAAKANLAMQIFGRSGAELIPLLNAGGEGLRAMAEESDKLGNTISTRTAVASEQLNDNITRLQTNVAGLGRTAAAEVIPAMVELSNVMVSFANNTRVGEVAGAAFRTVLETISVLGSEAAFMVETIARRIGGMAAQLAAVRRLDFRGAVEIGRMINEDDRAMRQRIDDFQKRVMGLNQQVTTAAQERIAPPTLVLEDPRGATGGGTRGGGGGGGRQAQSAGITNPLDDALAAWQERDAKAREAQEEADRTYWQNRITRIEEGLLSESELMAKKYQQDLERLETAMLTEDERRLAREALELEHITRMGEIEAKGHAMRIQAEADAAAELERIRLANMTNLERFTAMSYGNQAKHVAKAMSDQLTSVNTNSRAMFNIQKAANISQAIMDTYAGATRALKDYPAPWSYAVAGATMAAGLARVASIKSQSFGGASAAAAGGGGVSATNGMAQNAPRQMDQTVTIQGMNSGDLFSGDAVRTLIDRLIDAQRNGARIVLA
jgi:hypothetical protein